MRRREEGRGNLKKRKNPRARTDFAIQLQAICFCVSKRFAKICRASITADVLHKSEMDCISCSDLWLVVVVVSSLAHTRLLLHHWTSIFHSTLNGPATLSSRLHHLSQETTAMMFHSSFSSSSSTTIFATFLCLLAARASIPLVAKTMTSIKRSIQLQHCPASTLKEAASLPTMPMLSMQGSPSLLQLEELVSMKNPSPNLYVLVLAFLLGAAISPSLTLTIALLSDMLDVVLRCSWPDMTILWHLELRYHMTIQKEVEVHLNVHLHI